MGSGPLREAVVSELRTRAQRGDTPAEIATWLIQELGSPTSFQIIIYWREAFDTSIPVLKNAYDWVGLGDGGTLSDDALNQMLSPLVVRPHDTEWVQYPDGSWRSR
ncbi:hypothetical protein JK358_34840 [Nocardia sp. 2]|uniref:Uncharacterized protein n=1 Tax=Nocardia acididurans TaxID=2802282 RepID=A0ABS1MH48_9NOCA|nr:hypothetical protein [Nocardia acididurans]MBL1079594.1 hypothetical protein [Nocardia acididurans]